MEKILKLEGVTARKLYSTASGEFKALLEENFGKEFFSHKITDRIKTFEDIMQDALQWYNSVKDNITDKVKTKIQKIIYNILLNHVLGGRLTNNDRIRLIVFVLNEGWEGDWKNSNQHKYYPYFERKASSWAVGFGYFVFNAFLEAGFYYKSSELALYGANQFVNEYIEYLPE